MVQLLTGAVVAASKSMSTRPCEDCYTWKSERRALRIGIYWLSFNRADMRSDELSQVLLKPQHVTRFFGCGQATAQRGNDVFRFID